MTERRAGSVVRVCAVGAGLLVPAVGVLADPPSSTYRLKFADEFNGTALDTTKWSSASPSWSMPNSISTNSASDVAVTGGNLVISANRTSATAFDSGSVSSYTKFNFTGGYVEARIDLPSTPGSWPAFWGLYTGWPPEADIMEYPLTTDGGTSGYANNKYSTNFHYTNSSGAAAAGAGVVTTSQNLGTTGYHTFGMDWISNTKVDFYLDGAKVQSFTSSSVAQMASMYMILDYAVGGWPGTPSTTQWPVGWTDQMKVDYVRVYQANPNTSSDAASSWTINGSGSFSTAGNWSTGAPGYGGQSAVFGRVGTATAATITMPTWTVTGGLLFKGGSDGTTAYTIGTTSNAIQLAGTSSTVAASVQADSTSTANQAVNANVELWSPVTFRNDMTTGNTLTFNGVISGNGDLTVIGAGKVVFSNNNTMTGDTYIGTSITPTATALVTRSRPFGSTGTLYLGMQGNTNAGLVQIQDSRSVPNSVQFAGRGASATNNFTPGIQNLSGNNEFSGTLSLVRGGANYVVQSDAGLLTLSGSADATSPGVALRVDPTVTGNRLFTLQGVGNGLISGSVQNGGGVLALAKQGAGTWTLSGTNTFTGGLTIGAGTLIASSGGALGVGTVSVSGSTLALNSNTAVAGLTGLSVGTGSTLSLAAGSSLTLSSGTFSIGDITLNLNSGFDAPGLYTLIDGVTGTNTLGQLTLSGVNAATYNYAVNLTGNDVVLSVTTAVPEPAVLTTGIAAGAFLLRRRRQR